MGIPRLDNPDFDDYYLTVIVDTPFVEAIHNNCPPHYVIIEHSKAYNNLAEGAAAVSFEIYSSCTMQVYDMFHQIGIPLDQKMAYAVLAGIMTDTGFFQLRIKPLVFRMVAELLEGYNLDFQTCLKLMGENAHKKQGDVLSVLKAIKQGEIHTINNWTILLTCADNPLQAICIRQAIARLGVSLVLIETESDNFSMVYMYAGGLLQEENQYYLEIIEKLSECYDVFSGSHYGGVKTNVSNYNLTQACLEIVREVLSRVNIK